MYAPNGGMHVMLQITAQCWIDFACIGTSEERNQSKLFTKTGMNPDHCDSTFERFDCMCITLFSGRLLGKLQYIWGYQIYA